MDQQDKLGAMHTSERIPSVRPRPRHSSRGIAPFIQAWQAWHGLAGRGGAWMGTVCFGRRGGTRFRKSVPGLAGQASLGTLRHEVARQCGRSLERQAWQGEAGGAGPGTARRGKARPCNAGGVSRENQKGGDSE